MGASTWMIYGATGYTGELIARRATELGLRPLLAGRTKAKLLPLAQELGLEFLAFDLSDPAAVRMAVSGLTLVLHCAGPFVHTSQPMADACLAAGAHYLDITGEISVFEALHGRHGEAKRRGVMLMPGVGFDVVPGDCLAAHLVRALPAATHLTLAVCPTGGSQLSRGTATTAVELLPQGGRVRRHGELVPVAVGAASRMVDLGRGLRQVLLAPMPELTSAFVSTGIPNIECYLRLPGSVRLTKYIRPLLAWAPLQRWLKQRIAAGPAGPNAEQRTRARVLLWGEVRDDQGQVVRARLETPEGYALTVETALAITQRALAGDAPVGFQTPSTAYGADFVLAFAGVTRTDLQ